MKLARSNACSENYSRVAEIIEYIEQNYHEQPTLENLAARFGCSPFHFQRIFSDWAGISPKQFLKAVTLSNAKEIIKSTSVLETSLELGLSSPSRLHDLFVTVDAITPGQYKNCGEGLQISYGIHNSPFGECLLAISNHGIVELNFLNSEAERTPGINDLIKKWPRATIHNNPDATKELVEKVFYPSSHEQLKLHLRGTNFQIKIWQTLLTLPQGSLTTYEAVAKAAGNTKAVRAAGSAVGDNPIAYLIPCHRVLRKDGGIGGYATGTVRKRAMLGLELI